MLYFLVCKSAAHQTTFIISGKVLPGISKELNYIKVQWKLHLNLYEASLKTGPVLQRGSSLKGSTWHKRICLKIFHNSGRPFYFSGSPI